MHQYIEDSSLVNYQRTPAIYSRKNIQEDTLDTILSSYLNDMQRHDMGMVVVGNDRKLYSPGTDNPDVHSSEAYHMEQVVAKYLMSKNGEDFVRYVTHDRGKEFVKIKGVGAGDLGESTVAAILMNDSEGILLANYNGVPFEERVSKMAEIYGVNSDSMREYVITHELAHAAGHRTEESCEKFVKEFYLNQANKAETLEQTAEYLALADIAEQREQDAAEQGK